MNKNNNNNDNSWDAEDTYNGREQHADTLYGDSTLQEEPPSVKHYPRKDTAHQG